MSRSPPGPSGDAPPEPGADAPALAGVFRAEALEYRARGRAEGRVLRFDPAWTGQTYWLLVAAGLAAALWALLGRVDEYAVGSAVVRMEGRVDVTSPVAGTVDTVAVVPGQRVAAGDVLAALHDAREVAELARIEAEFEEQLVRLLHAPGDVDVRSALVPLRAQRDLARARVEERRVRAPRAGVVGDVRVRPGQQVQPGDLVATLAGPDARFRVVALLPGQYRPLLRRGMPLRLEVQGYALAWQEVVIDALGDEVIGPVEARRYLGPVADTLAPSGPVVLVEARLPGRRFVAGGRTLAYHEGMAARAEVSVRSESILAMLVPGLRNALGDHGR